MNNNSQNTNELKDKISLINRDDAEANRIKELRFRATHCVCRYCGQKLDLRKITYAAYNQVRIELYCEQCNRIENGTEKEIYQVAEYFVDELGFDHYPGVDASIRKKRMNVALICDIIAWGFKNTGLLNNEGFKVDLDMDMGNLGEVTLISDSDLKVMKGE